MLTIRDRSESKYDSIVKEVEDAYRVEENTIQFDEKGARIYDKKILKDRADNAANQKLDELIKKELPAYKIPEN